jgi:Mechanosensitive ion channel
VFCALASAATLDLASKAREVLEPSAGPSHAAIVRYALLLIGAVTTLIITLGLLGIPIGQLVLGGALTSVFVGIAAQQSLSNVFAGIVLMLAHPFRIGDGIRLQAGALGGQVSGTIVEVGITYVRISTSTGVLSIPNSQVLNCIIGPLPEPADSQTPPPVMALPAVQPTPPAPPPMATRIVTHVRVPDSQPSDSEPSEGQAADSHPEVPAGTPEPRPSGTPT